MIERAAILSTGDELTTGRIVDSNASWIADKLFEIGVDVVCVLTVGDWPERLAWAWRQAIAMVADGEHRDQVDADLEQLVGDPARVRVDDPSGGELVPRGEHRRAKRHTSSRTRRATAPA